MFHTVLIITLFGSVVTFGFGSKFEFDGLDAVAFSLGMINILNFFSIGCHVDTRDGIVCWDLLLSLCELNLNNPKQLRK